MSEEYPHYNGLPPHSNDSTSRDAAVAIQPHVTRLAARVLNLITAQGKEGLTCDEIEDWGNLSHQCASARVRELAMKGRIKDSGQKRKTRSQRFAIVWVAIGEEHA